MRLIPNIEASALFLFASVMLHFIYISSAFSGQTHSNDPNACRGPKYSDVNMAYFCCDGYTKDAEANLTAYCRECPDGTYGENCRGKCTCDNGSTCNRVDGVCLCPQGYHGGKCEFSCNCKDGSTCDMVDGSCICPSGRHGSACQNICNCPKDTTCDGKTGKCSCQEGFYGSPPSTTCKRCHCTENAKCDPSEGCVCKSGYYGPRCDKQCLCYNGASCSTVDPDECECARGWAGRSCEQCDSNILKENNRPYCEDRCFMCYNGHECQPSEGNCLCLPGWHGNWCDRKCDEGYYGANCMSKCLCLNEGSCDHVTGVCQCRPGYLGKNCDQPCPDNCVDCKDDRCVSCKPGWIGIQCKTPCQTGFYSESCRKRCECNCSDSCNHVNGSCPSYVRCDNNSCRCKNEATCIEHLKKCDCNPGWIGQDCSVSASTPRNYGENNYTTSTGHLNTNETSKLPLRRDGNIYDVMLGLLILALLTVAIVTALIFVRKCWQSRGRSFGVTTQGNLPDVNRVTFISYSTVAETQTSVSFSAGSERETSFPIHATIKESAKHPCKKSDAGADENEAFLGDPLQDSPTQQNDQ